MANLGPIGEVVFQDFFAAYTVNAGSVAPLTDGAMTGGIAWVGSGDAGDTVFTRTVTAGYGIHMVGTTAATNNNMLEFNSPSLLFTGQMGHNEIEIIVAFSSLADIAFNFGFNDEVTDSGNTLPVELSTTTWTTGADTFVGFVYDTNADNDDLHVMWTDDGSDTSTAIANLRCTGMVPTASKWFYMKVAIDDLGSSNGAVRATFTACDHTGKTVEKIFNTTVDRDCPLCYYFGVENRTTTAKTTYIKMAGYKQSIADL